MTATERPGWWRRLELRREALGHTTKDTARLLGVTGQTLYNWRDGARPDNPDAVRSLAEYLDEDFPSLWSELRREPDDGMTALLRSYAARDLNAAYAQINRSLLAEFLDPEHPGGVELVDIVLRRLRRDFPDATFGLLLLRRGGRRSRPFQYAIRVFVKGQDPVQLREQALPRSLGRARLPVSIEHSLELLPEEWRDGYPAVLVPIHLAARTAGWERYPIGGAVVLILGPWYSGAPDTAALLAETLDAGSDSITNFTAAFGRWDLGSKRTDPDLEVRQTQLAQLLTSHPAPMNGPFVWANNDVAPVVSPTVREQLARTFRGHLVVLELDERLLAYAAHRSSTASGRTPDEELASLRDQQTSLLATAKERAEQYRDEQGEEAAVHTVTLHLPPEVRSKEERAGTDTGMPLHAQTWRDAVDELFDLYCDVGEALAQALIDMHQSPASVPATPGQPSNLRRLDAQLVDGAWQLTPTGA